MYKYLAFLIIIFFTSCYKQELINPEKPDGLIEKHSLIDILIDIHLIDATLIVIQTKYNTDDSNTSKKYYNYILKKHNIKKHQFENSISYYSNFPNEMESIYDSVQVKLSTLEVMIAKPE